MKFNYTLDRVVAAMEMRGLKVFQGEYDLNIVGIRTAASTPNAFDDWVTVFHRRANGCWAFYAFQATTDPGTYWLENPMNVDGTAILSTGKHQSMWKLGKHKGYEALQQNAPVTVRRYPDQDDDPDGETVLDEGMFGINLHRANASRASGQVDKWSAGCQVLADPYDFEFLIALCHLQKSTHGWDTFSYVLLDEDELTAA